ncbi:MAG: Mut7-C RNAse domain-containing protein [Candidatus Lindowbacteria bacterium]|nr:Mut7-C RNAse domain-containing protein [Candidatus Lindowbacteria bacterium]
MNRDSLLATTTQPRFLADEMLGRLAKWLRLLGYDTRYVFDLSDSEIVALAESEERILLTRDVSLMQRKRCRSCIFVKSDHWREQLKQVYVDAGLNCKSILTVCTTCNHPLAVVERESIRSLVPPYVYVTQGKFSRCGNCSRIFWSATHVDQIVKELENLKKE